MVVTGNGRALVRPTLRQFAETTGVWQEPPTDTIDLVVIGSGPVGVAAVYTASEGLSVAVLDRRGRPAGGFLKIENFIGFPSGLSGNGLATPGVLPMLKFGAKIIAPAWVEPITPAGTPGNPSGVTASPATSPRRMAAG